MNLLTGGINNVPVTISDIKVSNLSLINEEVYWREKDSSPFITVP